MKRTSTNIRRKNLAMYAERLYYMRHNRLGEPPGELLQEWRGPYMHRNLREVEVALGRLSIPWHCVNVTYFNGEFGKEYLRFGFAKSNTPLRIRQDPLDPVVGAAQQAAEENANARHIVARSFILAPWSKAYPDLYPLLKKHATAFGLGDHELAEVEDYLSLDVETLECEYYDLDDLDIQIKRML